MLRFFLNVFIALTILSYTGFAQHDDARDEVYKMLASCDDLKTASFRLISKERLADGTFHESEILVKLQRNPRNVYIYCVNPNPGAECLWRAGELNNHLLVNPNGFPFFNLKLHSHHALLRQDQHHTVDEVGFDYIAEIFRHYIRKYGEEIFNLFSLMGTEEFDGHQCTVLQYDNPEYRYEDYRAGEKENLTSIASANYVSDYMLLAVNRMKNYDGVKSGQLVKLPVTYGKKIILYLDEHNHLPLMQMIYDEKGLYEKYEVKSFVLNPKFVPEDFSSANKKYGF